MTWRERVARFGQDETLVGVLTEPVQRATARPAVIILNSGLLHRVGASRLYVRIARQFAAQGHVALRFDFSGIGDSEPRRDAMPFSESGPLEVREAMDWLARTCGAERFVLVGLCSGADVAQAVSAQDPRIVGLGLLDPISYHTTQFWLRYYARRIARPAYWRRWVRVRLRRVRRLIATDQPAPMAVPRFERWIPPRDQTAELLRSLVSRGVRMMFLFSDGLGDHYNHVGQYRAAFPDVRLGDSLREEHIAGSDHIITDLSHQERVLALFARWSEELGGTAVRAGGALEPGTARGRAARGA